jgi:hypothetical protein
MGTAIKYDSNDAMEVINCSLATELSIHSFNGPKRKSKTFLYSVNGPLGRQFALIVGNLEPETGRFSTKQSRIVLEHCDVPVLGGVEPMNENSGSRRLRQSDSKLVSPNQTNVMVTDEPGLKRLLRWYAGRSV